MNTQYKAHKLKRSIIQFGKDTGKKIGRHIPESFFHHVQNNWVYDSRIKDLGITREHTPLFDTVFFEVRTRCNSRCSFCAASVQNESRPDTSLPLELYTKVIKELKEMDYTGRIAYHVNNDPLLFPKLHEYVAIAREMVPNAWIQILTNGLALNKKKGELLVQCGINELTINDYNDDLGADVPKRIQTFRNEILPKYYQEDEIKSGHGRDDAYPKLFRFNYIRSKLTTTKTTRAGTAPNKNEKTGNPRGFCDYPFTQFNITTDGTVNKCCADLFFSDPMGNVAESSLLDIWYGEKFKDTRSKLIDGDRCAIGTCEKCDYYGVKGVENKAGNLLFRMLRALD